MEIKLNPSLDSIVRAVTATPPARRIMLEDVDGFESSHALESRLAALPEIRPEKLEQARLMIGDPAYPPQQTIRSIAVLLAMDLEASTDLI
jgi:hypothetical protein